MYVKKDYLRLINGSDFDRAFFAELASADTNVEAYERVEGRYVNIFGKRKYKNYESYRKCRDRRLR
jgi:hypothetical protein